MRTDTPADLDHVEAACSRLVIDFANGMDRRDYPGVMALFAENATLDRAGLVMRGSQEIRAFLDQRPAQSMTRHLCSNIRVQQRSEDKADGSCYVQFFQSTPAQGEPLPVKASVVAVAEYALVFERQQDDWRIQDLRIRSVFQV